MVVIAHRRLRNFWTTHADAETSLRMCYKATLSADWSKFADARATFGNSSAVGNCVVFNNGGNKYRLVTRIRYAIRTMFILRIIGPHRSSTRMNALWACKPT